ncbi:hypothetical protein E4U36_001748 [Claviceps purpurea]|nr:hypothetical protein E4U36_001748 [Claviceps purpurea]
MEPYSSCGAPDDSSFGPAVASCHRTFDFTLLFEDLVFGIIPSAVFIVCAAPRFYYLCKSPVVVASSQLHRIKLILAAALVIVQCALLVVQTGHIKSPSTSVSISAATLLMVAGLSTCLVSHYEHRRSIRPSGLLIAYMFLMILFDGVKIRTHHSIGNKNLLIILSVDLALRVLQFLAECKNKRKSLLGSCSEKGPEQVAGPISRTFFYWLHNLMLRGYKSHLSMEDMGEIDDCLFSTSITKRLSSINSQRINGRLSSRGLPMILLRCLGRKALYPVIPRLALSAFTFSQPFLVNSMLSELSDGNPRDLTAGYGLIGATLLVYTGIAVSNAWYWQQINKSITIVRGTLVVLLYDKLLLIQEDPSIEPRAMTLMFSDTQRIMGSLNYIHETWAAIVETAVATWLLYIQTGNASFAMLAVSIVTSVVCFSLSKTISKKQQTWLGAVDRRLGPTKKMLSSLKAIQMLSAGERTMAAIKYLRQAELAISWPFRRLRVVTDVLSYAPMTLSPPIVFAVYIGLHPNSDDLQVTKLFTSLTLISLLATPLMHVCQAIPTLGAAHGCIKRIQSFLDMEDRRDPRRFSSADSFTHGGHVKEDKNPVYASIDTDDGTILSLTNVSLGWARDKAQLTGIDLNVKKGSKVAILGRVGCGKTLLFKGLLGEAAQIAGEITVRQDLKFAYCSQSPWLENVSVEMNLKQYAPDLVDAKVFDRLVQDCSLQDLINLQDYQVGTIGSGGVKLSGGQRQRLALARGLALKRDILLLDDVFSALDRRTRLHIAQNLLQAKESLGHIPTATTVIYTTHDKHIASMADEVYVITESGTLERLKMEDMASIEDTNPPMEDEADKPLAVKHKNETNSPDDKTAPDDAKKALGDRTVYKTYMQSMGFLNLTVFVLMGMVFAFTYKFPDIWIQWWSTAVSSPSDKQSHSTAYWISIYAVLEVLPLVLLALWTWHLFHNVVPAVGVSLHDSLLQTVLSAPFPFISSVDTGSMLNRFNQDLMLVDSLLPFDLVNTVEELFVAVIKVVFIAVASAQALAALPVVVVVLYMIQRFYLRTSKQLRLLDLEAKAILHTKVSDVSAHAGPSMIRAHGWQGVMRQNFMKKMDASQKPIYLLFSVQRWLQLVLNLVVAGLVVLVAGVAVAVRSKVNVGAIGVAFLNASTLGETLTHFIMAWTSLETSLGAIARIALFKRDTPSEQDPPSHIAPSSSSPTAPTSWWPSSGEVIFDNVWASYNPDSAGSGPSPSQDSNDPTWSLRGVSFTIHPGEHVTICGRTGSGKSTALLALLRMVHISMGSVYIDGTDHSHLPLSVLRKGFFVISQDILEESVPLRKQLDPDDAFSDARIQAVLTQCNLWQRISSEGDGLSSTATDLKLSAGEMQLFCLARTLLDAGSKEGGVLILDEATSSLDRETQRTIDAIVNTEFRNKTVISVSHRLDSSLTGSNRIIVMAEGRVVQDAGA